MSPVTIIDKYYPEDNERKHILLVHSRLVAEKALSIADHHPELQLDKDFLYEAGMLHDIGIFLTNAPGIFCFGDQPYVCHGYLGADLMRQEGYPRHALKGIRVQGYLWTILFRKSCQYLIGICSRLAWKSKSFALPISFIPRLIWSGKKQWRKPEKVFLISAMKV